MNRRLLALCAAALFLAGCRTSLTPSVESLIKLRQPRVDTELRETDCADPVTIPDRDLSWQETSKLWGQDRVALVDCGARNRANRGSVKVVTR